MNLQAHSPISFKYTSFWCPSLDPHLTKHHSIYRCPFNTSVGISLCKMWNSITSKYHIRPSNIEMNETLNQIRYSQQKPPCLKGNSNSTCLIAMHCKFPPWSLYKVTFSYSYVHYNPRAALRMKRWKKWRHNRKRSKQNLPILVRISNWYWTTCGLQLIHAELYVASHHSDCSLNKE